MFIYLLYIDPQCFVENAFVLKGRPMNRKVVAVALLIALLVAIVISLLVSNVISGS